MTVDLTDTAALETLELDVDVLVNNAGIQQREVTPGRPERDVAPGRAARDVDAREAGVPGPGADDRLAA